MGSGYQDQMQQMTARLEEYRKRLLDTQRKLAKQTVSVRSKDRSLTVVMGTQSDVREIKFNTDEYRSMAPAELGRALVEVLEQARTQARSKVSETMSPLMGFGDEIRGSMLGGSRSNDMLGELRKMWPRDVSGSTVGGRHEFEEDELDG